jgi:uncharacterized protein (TIGR04255 family)
MADKILKNKPLVEAILELRWALDGPETGVRFDPHYKLLLGRIYERLSADYPEHEQLPTASMPDEMVGHMVQHRFRREPLGWPLVQIGPGVLTVNETAGYVWSTFRDRCIVAIDKLFDAHPKPSELRVETISLRYIDAVDFDYKKENLLNFLRDKLKIRTDLPENLFEGMPIQRSPVQFQWHASFECAEPKGTVTMRFSAGQKDARPAVVWETLVESRRHSVPAMPTAFREWAEAAHRITDDWFFKLIEGDLARRFAGA